MGTPGLSESAAGARGFSRVRGVPAGSQKRPQQQYGPLCQLAARGASLTQRRSELSQSSGRSGLVDPWDDLHRTRKPSKGLNAMISIEKHYNLRTGLGQALAARPRVGLGSGAEAMGIRSAGAQTEIIPVQGSSTARAGGGGGGCGGNGIERGRWGLC